MSIKKKIILLSSINLILTCIIIYTGHSLYNDLYKARNLDYEKWLTENEKNHKLILLEKIKEVNTLNEEIFANDKELKQEAILLNQWINEAKKNDAILDKRIKAINSNIEKINKISFEFINSNSDKLATPSKKNSVTFLERRNLRNASQIIAYSNIILGHSNERISAEKMYLTVTSIKKEIEESERILSSKIYTDSVSITQLQDMAAEYSKISTELNIKLNRLAAISNGFIDSIESKKDIKRKEIFSKNEDDLLAIAGYLVLSIIALFAFSINIYFTIRKALKAFTENSLSNNEEARDIIKFYTKENEFSLFFKTIREFMAKQTRISNSLNQKSLNLEESSTEIQKIGASLSENSKTLVTQASQVASSTEEMNVNVGTIASTAEQMSVNITNVSDSISRINVNMENISKNSENLAGSMNKISKSSKESSNIANDANKKLTETTETIKPLGEAANEIGEVTDVIKRIAEKTNLLALNATIEAASAGEAGKGFAVVATEIKELASQSALAAEDIAMKIEGVQKSSMDTSSAINELASFVEKINESSESISDAVIEQTKNIETMSLNIEQTNHGIRSIANAVKELSVGSHELSKNSSEAANVTNEVANNIFNVSEELSNSTTGAKEIKISADKVLEVSNTLKNISKELLY